MTANDLLVLLRGKGVELAPVGGDLRVSGPPGVLSAELRGLIAASKPELLTLVVAEHAVTMTADGRDILAALSDRGIVVRLAEDGRPWAGPAELITESDRARLAEHRDAVLAALRAEAPASPPEGSEVGSEPAPVPAAPPVCPQCGQQDYMPLGGGWRRCWSCGGRWGPAGHQDPGDPPDLNLTAASLGLTRQPRIVILPRPSEELASSSPEAAIDEAAADYPKGVLCHRDGCRGLGWRRNAETSGWRCRACDGALLPDGSDDLHRHTDDVLAKQEPNGPEPLGVLCRGHGCGGLRWRWDATTGAWRCGKCGGPLPPWLLKEGV
jgi:TubC N-terminal docking domain